MLNQVAQGNEKAFEILYKEWEPRLSTYVFRITKSKELTQEILQDVFLKIWMSREALENVTNFKAYLFVVCRNQAINALKKSLRELAHIRMIQAGDPDPDTQPSAENPLDEAYPLIDQAICQLSERQREVFILSRQHRLTYQQIAEKLGIGKESVKTHLKLATASISSYLKDRIKLSLLLISLFSKIL